MIYGFRRGVTRGAYAQALGTERAADDLHRVAVQAGDVIFVPAGAIHALGPGIIVAEIQQNSDTTYRIYDWGRPRPLHLEQALAVLDFALVEPGPVAPKLLMEEDRLRIEQLVTCPYFETERITLPAGSEYFGLCDGSSFEIWAVLQGEANLTSDAPPVHMRAVAWVLLPAELGDFQVTTPVDTVLLRTFVP